MVRAVPTACGGTDSVTSDKDDTLANDCEEKNTVGALSTCTVSTNLAKMKKGAIRVRVTAEHDDVAANDHVPTLRGGMTQPEFTL